MTKAEAKAEALKRFSETMRYSPKTIEAYSDWVGQYITFISTGETREDRVGAFLTMLVIEKHVAVQTQKQALYALVLFYPLDVPLRKAA
jgi:hypothetical protein